MRYDRNRQLLEWTIHFGHNLLKALVVYFSRLYFSCKDERYDLIVSWHNKVTRELCSKVCLANSCGISLTTIFCVLSVIDMHGTRVSLDSWDSVLWQNKYWSCSFSHNIPPKYSRNKIERDYFAETACGQSTLIIKPAVLEKKKKYALWHFST